MTLHLCATCGVERAGAPLPGDVCPICADERQYVPVDGQRWTTLDELQTQGHRLASREIEPGLIGLHTEPRVGIGQESLLVVTDAGCLLWDPPAYLDEAAVSLVRAHGPVLAVAASHPHMFGLQVEWAHALDAKVLVNAADQEWVQRADERIRAWSGVEHPLPGVSLHQVGGHFPGSAVVLVESGAGGGGTLLSGDTIFVNPDGSAAFMRSYPNLIPLSGNVVRRIAASLNDFRFEMMINNFGSVITANAAQVVQRSARRHIAWVNGDFDELT